MKTSCNNDPLNRIMSSTFTYNVDLSADYPVNTGTILSIAICMRCSVFSIQGLPQCTAFFPSQNYQVNRPFTMLHVT